MLERNPDYAWAPSIYQNQGVPRVERIEFRFFTDPPTRALALESGDVQIVGELLPTDAELMAGNTRVQVYPVPIPGQPLQFHLNTQRWPTNDLTVRRALLLGTNRAEIVDSVFQGFSQVAHGPLSAVTAYYEPALADGYRFDFAQARAMLEGIGFVDTDGDRVLDFEGRPLKLDVVIPSWGLLSQVAQLLEAQWEALGADVHVVQVPSFTALQAAADTNEYNAIALNFFGVDPSLLDQFFLSNAPLNWSRVADLDLDLLLAEGTHASDPERRRSVYSETQRRIMDLALIIPIRDYVNLNGATADLQGLHFDAYGFYPILTDLRRAEAQ
ncbi:MAG: ABC transporter substrate-binding protein [Anaerolineae bacterium]|nr:ABC transporter substrate-binding protein [Anaerolineae bacterium]